jgi:hypothetical protein
MVIKDKDYYSWKGDKASEERLAEINADMAVAKIIGYRILEFFHLNESQLHDMFKTIGTDYQSPGTEMVSPRDLKDILMPGDLDPCVTTPPETPLPETPLPETPPPETPPPPSKLRITIPGRRTERGRGRGNNK